jgi:hypothetical protein
LRAALEAVGVEFTNDSEPGVKLKAKPQSIAGEDLNASNDEGAFDFGGASLR